MALNTGKQYTVRSVPDQVDAVLRQRAKNTGKSFNQVLLEALSEAANASSPRRDLSFLVGSLSHKEADLVDAEIDFQRRVDPDLWR